MSAPKATGRALWDWVGSASYWAVFAGIEAMIYADGGSPLALGLAVLLGLLSLNAGERRVRAAKVVIEYDHGHYAEVLDRISRAMERARP